MHIVKSHHVDSSEPDSDGFCEWRYEYDLYRFSDGGTVLVARCYASEPGDVHLLRLEEGGALRPITRAALGRPLIREALAYLRRAGFNHVHALLENGYEQITFET